ncbi:hypothetical protein B0T10DRAFT_611342 [Thelonectria olida]|uniref:Protein kinase domain-containing protein n=1 Tax=Thelonectria olida TaxID=1576542 RepID=A0A9P9AIK3_9HYPO|nr:hypothetical protein B0T10DRAFT_611342 [Thelonectria olida]
MDLIHMRRRYVTSHPSPTRAADSPYVQGPVEFIKLALDSLHVPYLYLKPSLRLQAGEGASFQVQYFDIDPGHLDKQVLSRIQSQASAWRGSWLIAKHIGPPTSPLWREAIAAEGVGADRLRLDAMVREMRILSHQSLRSHDSIVSAFGFSWDKDEDEFGRRWPVLIMEGADCGSLDEFIQLADAAWWTLDLALSISADIASGLEALHQCGIVHGDLKPDNILIFERKDGGFRAKISDFGSSTILSDIKSFAAGSELATLTLPGYSPPWEAPEAHGSIPLGNIQKVDVYGFGLLVCQLAVGKLDLWAPFCRCDHSHLDGTPYDLDRIDELKDESTQMISYAKQVLSTVAAPCSSNSSQLYSIVDNTLHNLPSRRASMSTLATILNADRTHHGNASQRANHDTACSIPPLPEDDVLSDEHPQYQDFSRWNRDLMLSASADIVMNWSGRCEAEIGSKDPERVARVAQMLFWLSRSILSGSLTCSSSTQALEWMVTAARAGSLEAKASINNLFSALQIPMPREEIMDWLSDGCYGGEGIAEWGLKEEFPDAYPTVLQRVRTTFCGYGQDCFGERWRTEYPIDYLEEILDDYISEHGDVNELHNAEGLVCSMTWLHYAASNGRVDLLQYLVEKGADPNILNGYGESPLFMACQGGHLEAASFLCPLTQGPSSDAGNLAKNELHHLVRFDPENVDMAARMLSEWGAQLDQRDDDQQQTPLAFILNQHGPNSEGAVGALLRLGADPLVKDYHGLDCLAHAACQLSPGLVELVLDYIPVHEIIQSQAHAIWFLLELDKYSLLVNGGSNYIDRVQATLGLLLNHEVSQIFMEMTQHSIFTFACAKAPLAVTKVLHGLGPRVSLNEFVLSAKEFYTPLMAAVVCSRPEIVTFLLELGADPCLPHPKWLWTPLFYAVSGPPEIVSSLIGVVEDTHGWDAAHDFVSMRDENGATAFDIAVRGQFFRAADILVPYKPPFLEFAFRYEPGSTCFYNTLGLAVYERRQLIYLLDILGSQTLPPIIDNQGTTVLHIVCGVPIDRVPEEEAESIVDSVTARFPHPDNANLQNTQEETPLHYASRFGNVHALRKLEEVYGNALDWHATSHNGWNALDEALSRDYQDISDLGLLARTWFRRRTSEIIALLRERGVIGESAIRS